ncbi:hypothetical protein C8Q76DRAFT_856936 [Earliella scabrosa]|nr:hypothetical protein C8Q76DRAFT_856936 [Earliella scabrosa]
MSDNIEFTTVPRNEAEYLGSHSATNYESWEHASQAPRISVQESLSRQWLSHDLVGHAFGDVIPLPLAACILLSFLHHGVVTVVESTAGSESTISGTPVEKGRWVDVCLYAVQLVVQQESSSPRTPPLEERYTWRWADSLKTDMTADFLNVVGALAFGCASAISPSFGASHSPTIRFCTWPRGFPSTPQGQDALPDIFALPSTAFLDRATGRAEEFHHVGSPLHLIRKVFPKVFSTISSSKPTPEPHPTGADARPALQEGARSCDGTESPDSRGASARFQAYDSTHFDSARDGPPDDDALRSLLQRLHRALEDQEVVSVFPKAVQENLGAQYLDRSYACWPGIPLSGQDKHLRKSSGILRALTCMQQQRYTQPYLRFVLGLSLTKDDVVFLRADALGIERCELDKGSTVGVVSIIRLVLGLTIADDEHLGVHPAFDFREVTVSSTATAGAPPKECITSTGATKRGPTPTDQIAPAAKRPGAVPPFVRQDPAQYRYREASFATIPDVGRYFLVRLIDNRRSLVGRLSRSWEAYREKPDGDYDGPFVLKLYCADVSTEAYQHEIIEKLIASGRDDRKRYILLPDRMSKLDSVLASVRGFTDPMSLPPSVQPMNDRMEVVTVTPMKRNLSQFEDVHELVFAFRDVYRGVQYLAELGYLHKDISLGNILLAREDLSGIPREKAFTINVLLRGAREATPQTIKLVRRETHQEEDVYGLLHDFDMAGLIGPAQGKPGANSSTPRVRTGTPPCMSINVLSNRFEQHFVADDIESVFYATYLLPFTYDTPSRFPECQTPARWPSSVTYHFIDGINLHDLSTRKNDYFSTPESWLEAFFKHGRPYWQDCERREIWKTMLLKLHEAVWKQRETDRLGRIEFYPRLRDDVDLACAAIDSVIGESWLCTLQVPPCHSSTLSRTLPSGATGDNIRGRVATSRARREGSGGWL